MQTRLGTHDGRVADRLEQRVEPVACERGGRDAQPDLVPALRGDVFETRVHVVGLERLDGVPPKQPEVVERQTTLARLGVLGFHEERHERAAAPQMGRVHLTHGAGAHDENLHGSPSPRIP